MAAETEQQSSVVLGGVDLAAGAGIKAVGPFMFTSPFLDGDARPKRFHNSYWQCEASTRIRSLTNEPKLLALYNRLRRKLIVRPGDDDELPAASPHASQVLLVGSGAATSGGPWAVLLFPRFFRPFHRLSDFYGNRMESIK